MFERRYISAVVIVIQLAWAVAELPAQSVDSAANYSQSEGTWVSGTHRGDYHFGDWIFDGSDSSNAGRFIGDSSPGGSDINTDGKSFGMYGHSGTFAGAARRFAKPVWTTGDSFSLQLAVNFRNGSKGFNLRNAAGENVWLFLTGQVDGNSGNYVNGMNIGMNTYHANTIFTITFTQRARDLVWTVERSGGLAGLASGTSSVPSGVIRDIRFFVANTDNNLAANNFYFNNLVFTPAVRGNSPLTPGERRFPGFEPSYFLEYEDPTAGSVTFRSSYDGWTTSYPLTKSGDVWQMDIRDAGLPPGWHTFKFRPNSNYESGDNRRIYIRGDGKIAKPPAVYLTWQNDPTTTMTIQWHTYQPDHTTARYRLRNSADSWATVTSFVTRVFGVTERKVQMAEITGLSPGTDYEFDVDGYDEVYYFRTMPATLDEPLRTMFTGDILFGEVADAMAVTMSAFDPAFLMIGGDLVYSDSRAEQFWMEYIFFDKWHTRFRAPDGRLIPLIMGIGNHEVRKAYITGYPYYENTDAWRDREAIYFYRAYAFPGQPGYNTLDFGDYLSLIVLDTDHLNPIVGAQTAWLADQLETRRHVRHLFPVYHVPAYPSVRSSADARNASIRTHWVPLFENAGVHMAFEHHDHAFKRTTPLLNNAIHDDGIVFMGDGAWGVATRDVKEAEGRHDIQLSEKRHHAYLVTLTDTGRTVQAIDVNGAIFDQTSQIGDGIPDAPANVAAQKVWAKTVSIGWSPSLRARQYRVERDGVQIGITTQPHFTDTNRTPDSIAQYQVLASNRSGESIGSTPLNVATIPIPPSPGIPASLAAVPLGPSGVELSWLTAPHAETYTVFRDDVEIASQLVDPMYSDAGLNPETLFAYRVRADNMTGSSGLSGPAVVTTDAPTVPYALDGQAESPGYLLASPGMTLYAAIRGTELYVATWSPAFDVNDHFVFITDHLLPRATTQAPWGKKGFTAQPVGSPVLASESSADYIEWNPSPPGSAAFRSPLGDGKIEGTIDLIQAFGQTPSMLYLASAAYGTEDLHSLRAQAPTGNGDENIDPQEFFAVPVNAIRDSLGIGIYDRLDPLRDFAVSGNEQMTSPAFVVRWRAVPGRSYHIWRCESLDAEMNWVRITANPIVAPSGADEMEYVDTESNLLDQAIYRVDVL